MDSKNARDYRGKVSDSETVSMWQSLGFGCCWPSPAASPPELPQMARCARPEDRPPVVNHFAVAALQEGRIFLRVQLRRSTTAAAKSPATISAAMMPLRSRPAWWSACLLAAPSYTLSDICEVSSFVPRALVATIVDRHSSPF